MKDNFNRQWLEDYKVNPRRDNIIYKNYQSPNAPTTDNSLLAGLSPLQRGRYAQFINDTPSEVKTLSAAGMQKYLQEANEREQRLKQEKIAYDRQATQLKAQQQAEAQRQSQLRTQQVPQVSLQPGSIKNIPPKSLAMTKALFTNRALPTEEQIRASQPPGRGAMLKALLGGPWSK